MSESWSSRTILTCGAVAWLFASCSDDAQQRDQRDPLAQPSAAHPVPVVASPAASAQPAASSAGNSYVPTAPGAAGARVDAALPADPDGALPCEVARIVDRHCASCHAAAGSAPMALGSVADFATELHGQTVAELVKYRLNASEPRLAMPPAGYGRLRADELVTINGWLERGAPAGTDVCSSGPPDSAVPPADGSPALAATPDGDLVCYPLLAHAGDGDTPYPVGVATDALVTFTFAAPWSTTAYAVLFRPVIDSVKSVHHWLLYQDDVPGTPGAIATSSGAHSDAQLVAAWAPGTDPLDFRKTGVDVGLELPHNKTYTLELHYNSSDPAARDRSGVEVCTHPRKPEHTASYSWLGSENFLFPADKWVGTCKPSNAEPIHILAIMPHMHYTGTHMKATLNRADGTRHVFHDSPFNFYYERLYLQQFTLEPGDSITTECTYSEPSTFGPGVDAEMCYLFTVAYPSGALVSPDLLGGFIHGGTACIGE